MLQMHVKLKQFCPTIELLLLEKTADTDAQSALCKTPTYPAMATAPRLQQAEGAE